MTTNKDLYVIDTATGELHYFEDRQIVGIETSGNALRIHAGNCVIEHRIDGDKRWRASDYLRDAATKPEHKALIMASHGVWDFGDGEVGVHLLKGPKTGSGGNLGTTIEGRIRFPEPSKRK